MNTSKDSGIIFCFSSFHNTLLENPRVLFYQCILQRLAATAQLLNWFHFGEKCGAQGSYFEGNTTTMEAHSPSEIFKAPQALISDEKLGSLCLSASENPTRVPFADSLPNLLVNSAMTCSRWHTTFEFYFSSCCLLISLWFWSLIFCVLDPNPNSFLRPIWHDGVWMVRSFAVFLCVQQNPRGSSSEPCTHFAFLRLKFSPQSQYCVLFIFELTT